MVQLMRIALVARGSSGEPPGADSPVWRPLEKESILGNFKRQCVRRVEEGWCVGEGNLVPLLSYRDDSWTYPTMTFEQPILRFFLNEGEKKKQ